MPLEYGSLFHEDSLVDYLLAAYPLNDEALRQGFEELLRQPGTISQDPYLEGNQLTTRARQFVNYQRRPS